MLEQLFGSKTRVALLRAFFRAPEHPLYVRELTRMIGVQINAVRRELDTLVDMGLLRLTSGTEQESAQKKYYAVVISHPLYAELYDLVMKGDVVAHESLARDIAEHGGHIVYLGLSGVFTSDTDAPTDMLVVGDNLREQAILRRISEYEKKSSLPIRYTIMSEEEFFDRRHMMDKFLYAFFESKLEIIVNTIKL